MDVTIEVKVRIPAKKVDLEITGCSQDLNTGLDKVLERLRKHLLLVADPEREPFLMLRQNPSLLEGAMQYQLDDDGA